MICAIRRVDRVACGDRCMSVPCSLAVTSRFRPSQFYAPCTPYRMCSIVSIGQFAFEVSSIRILWWQSVLLTFLFVRFNCFGNVEYPHFLKFLLDFMLLKLYVCFGFGCFASCAIVSQSKSTWFVESCPMMILCRTWSVRMPTVVNVSVPWVYLTLVERPRD